MTAPAPPTRVWRIVDLLQWGTDYFRDLDLDHPRREIERMLQHLLGYSRVDLYLQFDEPLTSDQLARLKAWILRRRNHEPLQYILGETEFYGLSLFTEPPVLIPRPESERLVDTALECLAEVDHPRLLDVGTGSGCLALALQQERPDARITAIDVDPAAVRLAQKNCARHGLEVEVVASSFADYQPEDAFDLILTNPPYVTRDEYAGLPPEIKAHESRRSLTDDADGLTLTREVIDRGPELLRPGGWLLIEVGREAQRQGAYTLLQTAGYRQVRWVQDYNGDDRVVVGRWL